MTRPAILDMDMAVTPRKIVPLPYDLQGDFCDDLSCEHGCAEMRQERDEFNRKHNGPDPAWDDVRKYVEGLEESVAFTMTDTSRILRKSDIKDVCPHPDDCFYEAERARCGPCAVKASKLAGIEIDDTHSHLPEVCRLRREVKAAESRISELEAEVKSLKDGHADTLSHWNATIVRAEDAYAEVDRLLGLLAEAGRVLAPFAKRAGILDGIWKDHETQWTPEHGSTAITIGDLRAASALAEKLEKEISNE